MEHFMTEAGRSPLEAIDVGFANYVARRRSADQKHTVKGIPDYAFALDCELREKLRNIPGFYSVSKKICETLVAREIQLINREGIAVGPSQFPEIYQMGADCAHRLGIGVPNIFIKNDVTLNAYTYAADDVSPLIVLHSGIVERMTPGELKCVIGHECGHIHNEHTMYRYVVSRILSSAGGQFGAVFSLANIALMQMWTRASEITADRAALICADDVEDAINVDAKLLYGATLNTDYKVDIDALRAQLEADLNSPVKVLEILTDHPHSIRRIMADKEFEECEVFYTWRPELKKPGMAARSKAETDRRCEKIIAILNNK